jgi:hypothetical protein
LALHQHAEALSRDLERMGSLASSPAAISEQLVENINRSYISYSKVSERVEFRACKLNYHLDCLDFEFKHFLQVLSPYVDPPAYHRKMCRLAC